MSEQIQYGGQAVIEGVMMRSPRHFAVACRKPDGDIIVRSELVENSILGRLKWLNKPFLRGTLALIDAMALGTRALKFASQVQLAESGPKPVAPAQTAAAEVLPGIPDPVVPSQPSARRTRINDIAIGGTMILAFMMGIGLFVALPTAATQLAQSQLGWREALTYGQQALLNGVDGAVRLSIFFTYIALIGRMENIRRVFQYHGAEHKAINTLESGEALTIENCLRASRIHPRCGTSFILIVLIAGVFVHCLFPRPENYFIRLGLHLALIPAIAGIGYEVIRLAGRYRHVPLMNALLSPGLWTQRLTTREPAPDQVEVALAALTAVVQLETGKEAAALPEAAAAAVA